MKKLVSMLVSLAMLASLNISTMIDVKAQDTVFTADGSGVIVLEAESGMITDADNAVVSSENAFGGSYVYKFVRNGDDQSPSVSWRVSIPDNQKYDVWALSLTSPGVGGEMNLMQMFYGDEGEAKDVARTDASIARYALSNVGTMAWHKVYSREAFGAGIDTLHYTMKTMGLHDLFAIDRVVIVPSNYYWSPSTTDYIGNNSNDYLTDDIPYDGRGICTPDESGVIVMEAERAIVTDALYKASAKAFGGEYIYNFNSPKEADPSLEWTVSIPDNRQYDVWALTLTSPGNGGGEMNLMQMFYGDEGEAKDVSRTNASMARYTGVEIRSDLSTYKLAWHKVYSKEVFGVGTDKMYYTMKECGMHNLFAIDRVVIVPSEYYWSPSTIDYIGNNSTEYFTDDVPHDCGAPFKADSKGVVWMEAENADSPAYSVTADENASGGKSIRKGDHIGDTELTFTTEFVFDITENDSYDVWVLGANDPATGWYSRYETALDGEAPKAYTNGYVYGGYDIRNFDMYTATVTGGSLPVRWTKANASVKLDSGRHIFDIIINDRAMGGGWYISQLDAVAVVPSKLNWVPYSVDAPVDVENGYAWIECENSIQETNFATVTYSAGAIGTYNQSASNGQYVHIDGGATPIYDNEKLDYNFTLANSGEYDIYFLGSLIDAEYLSNLYYTFDNTDSSIVDVNNTYKATASEVSSTYMRTSGTDVDKDYWQKIGSAINLTAGSHVLNTEWTQRDGKDPEGHDYDKHYLTMDVYAIVPTDWEWSMPTEQTYPVYTALDLDSTEKADMLRQKYAEGVTSDLEGLDTLGSAGSHFTYDAKNPSYIAADGTVTREVATEPKSARLEIFAHKAQYSTTSDESQTIRLYVLPLPTVECTDFSAIYNDGTEITENSLSSGKTVVASANLKKNDEETRNAIMAIAVYEQGRLLNIQSSEVVLTNTAQTLSTSLVLPDAADMSAYTLKVFLWDSLEDANPYAPALNY